MFRTTKRMTQFVTVLAILVLSLPALAHAGEQAVVIPAPLLDNPKASGPLQTAVLAGGCFWGVQGVYQHVRGVRTVLSGYAGGTRETAQYQMVSRGTTGHAESVEIRFDPKEVSYGEILRIFFSVVHDPTQLDRQGPDTGPQYRSNIFYADDAQRKVAQAYLVQLGKTSLFGRPIVTRVDALEGFYPAEAYHQDFLINNPQYPYIVINDLPKIENFRTLFPALYRVEAVTVKNSN